MMRDEPTVWFVTHPEVLVDPAIPVTRWRLSPLGVERATLLRDAAALARVRSVWHSAETKAIETARLAGPDRPRFELAALGENDRSATGFVPPKQFEQLADAFFREPDHSVSGWARAVDEQRRILTALDAILADPRCGEEDVLVVSHGAVGTLLWCALSGEPIDRRHDQPRQGCWYAVDRATRTPVAAWRPIEELTGVDDESH